MSKDKKLQYRNSIISSIGDAETIQITTFQDKVVTLHFSEFDTDIDVDELLTIHHHNIVGEIVTMPVLLNKIGLLRAQASDDYRDYEHDHKVLNADRSNYHRKAALAEGVRATNLDKEVKDRVTMDKAIQASFKTLLRLQRDMEFVESLYWAVKSKDDKVNKLGGNLTPRDMARELAEGRINLMMIQIRDNPM